MPNTTNFSFPTPADTDLVKDGASAIRSLGNSIDSTFVDLKGGTTGQVLSKTSNTDMDFTWVAQDDSNAIQNAIVDAKGDLISATAADTPARLAVGTNNQVLMADSATATGLKYANEATATLTAKGDLLSATAANTLARLAVGTNGQVLQADSTTATGLKWGAAGSSFVGVSTWKNTSNQSIANDTEVVITFNTEEFDTDGFHDNTTNSSRITIPTGKGGYYLLVGNLRFASNATGNRFVGFLKNGTTSVARMNRFNSNSGSTTFIGATALVSAVAGDYFEFRAYQNSGGNLDIEFSQADTRFGAYFLGA